MTRGKAAVTCTAKARSTGKRCGKAPVPGARVCRIHGGAAGQVQRKARERRAHAAVAGLLDAAVRDVQSRRADFAGTRLPPLGETIGAIADELRALASGLDAATARKFRAQIRRLDLLASVPE